MAQGNGAGATITSLEALQSEPAVNQIARRETGNLEEADAEGLSDYERGLLGPPMLVRVQQPQRFVGDHTEESRRRLVLWELP